MLEIKKKYTLPSGQILEICQGDITTAKVDAIVNAANAQLAHGGGVAAVISRKGGSTIQQESNAWISKHGPVSHNKPAYTSGGKLPRKFVIHAVGPVWGSGNEKNKLASAIKGSLELAHNLGLDSIAFPAISTGIFNFPVDLAADIFISTISKYFVEESKPFLKKVKLVLYDDASLNVFLKEFSRVFDNE